MSGWVAGGVVGLHLGEAESTNDVARAQADGGAPHGTWVVADRQTAGRGRLGRRWEAPAGSALFLSVMLRPRLEPAMVPLLCLGAAEQVAALHPALRIKWPNDVLLPDGRKVCGILAEAEITRGEVSVVVGIGVNLTAAPDLPTAGYIGELDGAPTDRRVVAARVVEGVLASCRRLEAGDAAGLVADWSARCGMLGAEVKVHAGDASVQGVAKRVDEGGTLWVEVDGIEQPVRAGDVEIVAWGTTRR